MFTRLEKRMRRTSFSYCIGMAVSRTVYIWLCLVLAGEKRWFPGFHDQLVPMKISHPCQHKTQQNIGSGYDWQLPCTVVCEPSCADLCRRKETNGDRERWTTGVISFFGVLCPFRGALNVCRFPPFSLMS
jgi:hypothetical protein